MRAYSIPSLYKNISKDFEVFADGARIGVYSCLVSAYPLNQTWPGYQRPLDQTERSSFVIIGSSGELAISIKPVIPFKDAKIRPSAKSIAKEIKDGVLEVILPGPGQYSIEFGNKHNVLTIFVNPEKDFDNTANEMLYFGPGIHYLEDKLKLESGQTVFIDEGAIVYGGIFAHNKNNISVVGYGILDCSRMERASLVASASAEEMSVSGNSGNPIFFANCRNIHIEGVTIVDAAEWSVRLDGCENAIVDNIKLIGMWRYNSDGCDFCNCTNAVIKNSYLRNFDDCIVVKGLNYNNELPVENIVAENCVIWCDWGKAFEVGAETCAPYIRNVCFKDSYIIHGTNIMLDILHGDRAEISDIRFEGIDIEYTGEEDQPMLQTEHDQKYEKSSEAFVPPLLFITSELTMWSTDDHVGDLKNIYVNDINIRAADFARPAAKIHKPDNNSVIENVIIKRIRLNNSDYQVQTDFEP